MNARGDAEPPTVLRLLGVQRSFGRLAVLRNVDLTVGAGEIIGILGANGAGKTTILQLTAGLLPPSGGSYEYFGRSVEQVDAATRAEIAFVTHTAQVYPRLTAEENVELFSALRRAAGYETNPTRPALARLGLGDVAQREAGTFSRGMLQRLALARALVGRPRLILLDEPFTALDREGRLRLATVLLEEARAGAAVLLSSHDLEALASVTSRVVLLERGTIRDQARKGPRVDATEAYRHALLDLFGRIAQAPPAGSAVPQSLSSDASSA